MAFGQQSGPPATHRQLTELGELLEAAGHTGFRDARYPMGFNQRQAGGKFSRDEAEGFIDQLRAAADAGEAPPHVAEASNTKPTPKRRQAAPVKTRSAQVGAGKGLDAFSDDDLATELQRRGWAVVQP